MKFALLEKCRNLSRRENNESARSEINEALSCFIYDDEEV